MAKKSKKKAKKAAPKSKTKARRAPARPVKKAAHPAKRGQAAKAVTGGPFPVKTGAGASPAEVGKSLVEMFNRGQFKEIEERWWSPAIVSIEGIGLQWVGRNAVDGKNKGWYEQNDIKGASAEGPFTGSTGFAVRFKMDVEERATGKRTLMDEVGVYTVQNGKIVREEFMYGPMPGGG